MAKINWSARRGINIAALILVVTALTACQAHQKSTITTVHKPNITVRINDTYPAEAKLVADLSEEMFGRVSKIIDRDNPGPIMIHIFDFPRAAWLGRANFRTGEIQIQRRLVQTPVRFKEVVAHELTHLMAGIAHGQNLFLTEGLATYIGTKILAEHNDRKGNRTYNIHRAFRKFANDSTRRVPTIIEVSGNPWLFGEGGKHTSLAYIMAASFVGYLVETFGIDKVMKVFDSGRYESHLGKDLEALSAEWRDSIGHSRTIVPIKEKNSATRESPVHLASLSDKFVCEKAVDIYYANHTRRYRWNTAKSREEFVDEVYRRKIRFSDCVVILKGN